MNISVAKDSKTCGIQAAKRAAEILRRALKTDEIVRFIAATGASQFDFLTALCQEEDIDWSRTEMFHLDEYVGIGSNHPASFVGYLQERLVSRVPIGNAHFIKGDADDPEAERKRISELISNGPIKVAFVGIGENGHLAFNDPPAQFDASDPYLILKLDEACRNQQVGEGWFDSISDVPAMAFTMSIQQIMRSEHIICTVPDARKATAVRHCLSDSEPISPNWPASILRKHDNCDVFLDEFSSSGL